MSANTRSKCIGGKSCSNVLKKVASKHSNSSVKHRLMHTKVDLFGEKLLKEVKQEIFNGVKQIFNEVALQESVKDEVAGLKFVKEEKVQELVKEKQLESEGSY